jgi:catechol 2,3-dioxygenase-like lactoylglutathione lyase family enzyme
MEMKLELVNVPVSDVDRAIEFYTKIGFNKDTDQKVNETLRFVQLTPPGSACSISIGTGFSEMKPGTIKGLQVVVKDIQEAHKHFLDAGVTVGDVDVQPWGSFVYFEDPDGNKWSVQQLPDYSKQPV